MNKKDYSISAIRMLSTLMIVVLHIFQQIEKINNKIHYATDWLNLGLVMFFTISAFLYSNRDINKETRIRWILHRYKELSIPSFIVCILTIIFYRIFIGDIPLRHIYYAILSSLGLQVFVLDSWMFIQLWFLTYIIFCYLTVPLIQKINVKEISTFKFFSIIIFFTIIFQGIGTVLKMKMGITVLSWGILLRFYLPYFIFRKYPIKSDSCKNIMKILSVLSMLLIVSTIFARYIWKPSGVLSSLVELLFIYTQTITGTVLFYLLYNLFTKISINSKVLEISDKYSYYIYLTHCLFIGYNTSVIYKFSNIFIGIIMALIFTVVASVVVHIITKNIKKLLQVKFNI